LTTWNDLLEEFRALGGTAENIRLGHGELGRGLFPVEPGKPVAIHIPDNLLVPVGDWVSEGGAPRVGPNAKTGEREKVWLNRYQEEFGWGGGGIDEVRRMFEMTGALSSELRLELATKYRCGPWFDEPTDQRIAARFFEAREITYKQSQVIMPLIEMANHGEGTHYDTESGVALRGLFPGEVLVEYNQLDSFDYFRVWGFTTQRQVAFSTAITGNIDSTPLTIGEGFTGALTSEKSWIPALEKKPGNVGLPFLLLGNRQFPRIPKGIFYRLMRQAGYFGFAEAFDLIHHTNRLGFINLLLTAEGIDLPIGRTLRTVASYHLRAMSFCYGAREI
jgi:hypothetical protein